MTELASVIDAVLDIRQPFGVPWTGAERAEIKTRAANAGLSVDAPHAITSFLLDVEQEQRRYLEEMPSGRARYKRHSPEAYRRFMEGRAAHRQWVRNVQRMERAGFKFKFMGYRGF